LLADEPGSGEVAHRTPVELSPALLLAAAFAAAWAAVYPHTPDLAAATYRVQLFHQLGMGLWDEHWYAGHHLPGYSLLLGPLGSALGLRLLGALCVLGSVALFERIVRPLYGERARWAACLFALAATGDVWVGRLAFALGVCLSLAALLAALHARTARAAALALLAAAASPVAGGLLALAGASWGIARRVRAPLALVVAPAALTIALAALFPEGGYEPYPLRSFLATLLVALAFLWALAPDQRVLRSGALVFLAASVLCVLVRSPMGSNVERYGVLLAGPLLLCARGRSRAHVAIAVCAAGVWTVWGPVRETLAVAGSEATSAAYYAPAERYLLARGPVRVEVPLTRSHWEAALLAPRVSLARGWEKQLDERYDGALLEPQLSARSYERWLREQAVSYVALPDARLDPSSAREGALIERGLPYLRETFASRHWRIYRVIAPAPILTGPGTLQTLGHDSFTLRAYAVASLIVRVRFTRYWTLTKGAGCVSRARGGWTRVSVRVPGEVRVAARFSLAAALGGERACRS
jgi:hypothetical protein